MSTTYAEPRSTLLRLNVDGEPSPSGLTYWEVVEGAHLGRTWYTVQHDGWLVAEVYEGPDGWRIASTPREPIPAAVLAEIPAACAAILGPRRGHR
jgi:hypothetical protein